VKTEPPRAGCDSEAVRDTGVRAIGGLPETFLESLAGHKWTNLAPYARLRVETGKSDFFWNPRIPRERGT